MFSIYLSFLNIMVSATLFINNKSFSIYPSDFKMQGSGHSHWFPIYRK